MFRWCIIFLFACHALGFATIDPNKAIHNTVDKLNQSLFSHDDIRVALLKDCPEVIPTLVDWMYNEWSNYDKELTKDRLACNFKKRCNDDCIPFVLVFYKNDVPVGMVGLKESGPLELAHLGQASPWGCSFYVLPEERSKGLGEKIARSILTIAARLGYSELFFYSSSPEAARWYLFRGAELVEKEPFRDHTAYVMKIAIPAYL